MILIITAIQPFSSASSSSVNPVRQETKLLLPAAVPIIELIYSSLVEYSCCGTVTVAAQVTVTHVEADLGHTMMSNDPKNNSKPAVFTSIFFHQKTNPATVPSLE